MNNNSMQTLLLKIDKNEWIICESRSQQGRKYFFNMLTGEKIWMDNTESEIALAEKFGKVGPEPGSPTINNPMDNTANIYNNQSSNQQSNFVLTASAGSPHTSWDNHQTQPVNLQQQFHHSQGQPVNLQHSIKLVPVYNDATVQTYHRLLAQTTNLHNNATFIPKQKYGQNQQTQIQRSLNSLNYGNYDWNEEQYHRQESTYNHTNGSDLRRKLIKRRRSCSGSSGYNDVNFQCEKSTKHEMKNRIEPVSAPAFKLQPLNLAPLKTLTATNPETNKWLIVVERDIILENYTFLDDMVTVDPDCHLVVPHHVISELKTFVSESSDVRPRRTLRFLTEQIENGMAMLGEPEEGDNSSEKTILTCEKLATRNNAVILIAKNKQTLTFKSNVNGIHVFTMRAVRDILETKSIKPRPSSPTMAIKICVPNNFNKETREPENTISRELFNHYGYNNQSGNNEKHYIIDMPPEPAMQISAIIRPESEIKNVSLEKTLSTPKTNSLNGFKIDDKNPHKPAMTNMSSKVQIISTQRIPGKNSPSGSKIDGNNSQKQASNLVAPLISPTPTTKAVPCNNNAVDEEDELSRRGSATSIAPTDPNKSNIHHTSPVKKPSDSSTEANKYSPTKPEFASPREMYKSKWNNSGNKNMRDTMDTCSTSSTSIISLDSINIKKIISMKKLITATSKGQIDNAKEITPLIERPKSPSSWASNDNDNTSERSLNKTVNKNLAMEETSTSGVISNSESFNSDKVINPKKKDVRKVSRKRSVVMYEVACQSMEEVLRLRSEEWVFRFVQIMEEVLRVKLQEKIPYEQKEPAPWNLQEAARCIIKKFDNHFDVVDAANKLSRFLYESSDENGKIMNIEPSDYMELYSYGVYLVETFLDMTCADCKEKDKNEKRRRFSEEKCSCHEVSTASELLKKLLFDIHNANVETFADYSSDFLLDSSVDETTHYNFNTKTRQQSSTEAVKMKMGEMESAENVKRYPLKKKQTDALEELTTKAKKTASLNCQQFTEKIGKAAEADEVPRKLQKKVMADDDTANYDFNMKTRQQSSTEAVKMKMGEMESAENVKRYPLKKKQTDALEEVTPKAKKTSSLNCQQFTKKVEKAAEADEVPRKLQKKVMADDDTANYDFNMKTRQQSSTEAVKMKMGEMESAENVKRYPLKRKQTDALEEVTLKTKKPSSFNCQQFTKKVEKAAEADEVPRKIQKKVMAGKRCKKLFFHSLQLRKNVDNNKKINGLSKEADDKILPKVRNITMGMNSDSAFFSSLQLDKKDLNNTDKLKACKITVECSNKADAPDEQKDPRSSPEDLIGLKCHFSNEDNLLDVSPSKVVCTFKRNEDIERRVKANCYRKRYEDSEPEENMTGEYNGTQGLIRSTDNNLGMNGMAASETFETVPVNNLYEQTIDGNHLAMEKQVHENEKFIEEEANAIFQGHIKNLTVKLAYVFTRVISLCDTYLMETMKNPSEKCTEEIHCKVKLAVSLLFKIHQGLESANQRENNYEYNFKTLLKLENNEDYFTDARFSLQYRHVIAECAKHATIILKAVRGDLKI